MSIISSYCSAKTEYRTSVIEGKGRFAKENIRQGETVAIRSGHLINGEQLESYAKIINDAEHQIADDFYLAPLTQEEFSHVMCFLNHSCTPNVGMLGNIIIVAMRDIKVGEELCLDYAMIFSHQKTFSCRCGVETCRKTITGKDWLRKDLQRKYGGYFSSYLLQKIERSKKA
jgi:hypothetical protein